MGTKQTAVQWLIEKIVEDQMYKAKSHKEWVNIFEQAKAMEKEQIMDAQMGMFNYINQNKFGLDYLNKRDTAEEYAEQYYTENYKSNNNGN